MPAAEKGSLHVELNHLVPGSYRVSTYTIGYRHNDAYTAYLHMGTPKQLLPEQVLSLQDAATGAPENVTQLDLIGGTYSRDLPLHANDVYLIVLIPIRAAKQ